MREQLDALHEAATPGPWDADFDEDSVSVNGGSARTTWDTSEDGNYSLGTAPGSWRSTDRILEHEVEESLGEGEPEDIEREQREANAKWIAESKTAWPEISKQLAAVERVRELHKPVDVEPSDTICGECSFRLPNGRYFGRLEEYPCATIRALDGEQ